MTEKYITKAASFILESYYEGKLSTDLEESVREWLVEGHNEYEKDLALYAIFDKVVNFESRAGKNICESYKELCTLLRLPIPIDLSSRELTLKTPGPIEKRALQHKFRAFQKTFYP